MHKIVAILLSCLAALMPYDTAGEVLDVDLPMRFDKGGSIVVPIKRDNVGSQRIDLSVHARQHKLLDFSVTLYGESDTARCHVRRCDNLHTDGFDSHYITITGTAHGESISANIPCGRRLGQCNDHVRIILDGEWLTLLYGNSTLERVSRISCSILADSMAISSASDFDLRRCELLTTDAPQYVMSQYSDLESISANADARLWRYFDETSDSRLAVRGGEYTLATVPEGDGLTLIYISGAGINSHAWTTGMIKGRLKPTSITGVYDMEWIDAEGAVMKHCSATFDGTFLILEFPTLSTRLRFAAKG